MNGLNPISQVIISIDKPLQDELITDSGLKFYIDPSYRKEWMASVTATIVALPLKCNPKDKKILDQLKIGDEICISYQVVADFNFRGDGSRFMLATEDNDYIKEFYNGKGESIRMYALPKRRGFAGAIWVGVYLDKRGKRIDGVQGSESELNKWMPQFQFGKTDEYTFNNFFEHNGNEYWKCNLTDIFAKKVNGELVAIGDRVICKPIEEKVPYGVAKHIIQTTTDVKIRYQDRGVTLTGGGEKEIKVDDIVSFNPQHCEKYNFYKKDYFLINQQLILGKWKQENTQTKAAANKT